MFAPCAVLLAGLLFSTPVPSPAEDAAFASILEMEDTRTGGAALLEHLDPARPPAVRLRAVLAIGRIGSPITTPYDLLGALTDPQPEMRRMAAFALGEMDDPRGAPLLATLLRDPDASVRALAAEGLGKLKDAGSAPALTAALADPDPDVAGLALLSLWKIDAGALLGEQVRRAAEFAREAEGELRARAVYFLMRSQLARPADAAIEAALLSAAKDPDPLIRSWAARGLGASTTPLATSVLLALAADADPQVRINAFNGLKARPVKAGCALHREALEDADRGVALAALASLESCEGEQGRELISRALVSKHPRFREVAALALAARDKQGALASLLPLTRDAVWSVRARSAEALALAGGTSAEASSALAGLASDPDPRVRLAAAEAWGKLDSADAAAARQRALEDSDPFVRAAALDALGGRLPEEAAARARLVETIAAAYRAAVGDAPNDARLAALASLARAGGPAARAALEAAMQDADALVRRRAAELLRQSFGVDRIASISGPPPSRDAQGYLEAVRRSRRRVTARIETAAGPIDIRLLPADAPLTVDNFIRIAREGRFDNLVFHRVVPNFVVQDGDPRGDGNGGPPWQIRCEINARRYGRGAVGMALSGKDTGGSQYFITHSPQPHLDGGYTVFGEVIAGQESVDRLVQGDAVRSMRVKEEAAP